MGLSRPRREFKSSRLLWPDSQRWTFSFPLPSCVPPILTSRGHQCPVQRALEPRRPFGVGLWDGADQEAG